MSVLASAVIANARHLLLDTNNAVERWSDALLLAALNEGQRALAILNPSATAKTTTVDLAVGTHQVLPADGMKFMSLTRNRGSGGTYGRVVTFTSFDALNLGYPNWHSMTPVVEVKQFSPDPFDPRRYYVYPPAASGAKADLSYSVSPADLASTSEAITVPDWYSPALVDYVVYRALSENDGDAPARERAQMHYVYFTNQVMGVPAYTPPRRTSSNG